MHLYASGSYLGYLTAKLAVCVPAPVTHFPGTEPGACFADPHFPWSPSLAPPAPRRIAPRCSPASQLLFRGSDFPRPCIIGYSSSLSRCGPGQKLANGQSWDLPVSSAVLLHVMCSLTPAVR